MSTNLRNWIKFGGLVGLAFVLGLFVAGLLDPLRSGMAQQPGRESRPPIVEVDAPRIPEAKPLADLSEAYSAIAEAVRPSVVFVLAERPEEVSANVASRLQLPPGVELPNSRRRPNHLDRSTGSGFIVSADGYMLTNDHVVAGATRVRVRLLDGRTLDARIVGRDPNTDVAVLKAEATGLRPASLGSSDKVRIGEWVLAIGNPLGDNLTFSVTQGIVSAKGRAGVAPDGVRPNVSDIQDFIQTDAAINRGNSGGPLVNVRGEVIGINSAIASMTGFYQGYAFAVPIDLARVVMNQIIEHGRVERTALGIIVETASAEDAVYLGLDSIAGVKINSFHEADSPAKRAGMQVGDVIISVDGQSVNYTAQLQQRVGFRRGGETVRVEVARKSGRKEFTVRLNSLPVEPDAVTVDSVVPATPSVTPRNRLGVVTDPLTPGLAGQSGLPGTTRGLLVRSIAQGSPAEERLVPFDMWRELRQAPDVIVEVEGRPVRTENDLRAAINDAQNGVVTLIVMSATGPNNTAQTRVVRVRLTP